MAVSSMFRAFLAASKWAIWEMGPQPRMPRRNWRESFFILTRCESRGLRQAHPSGGLDEGFDQGVGPRGEGGALRLKQRGDEERMMRQFDDPRFAGRVTAGNLQAAPGQWLLVTRVEAEVAVEALGDLVP